MAKKQSNRPKWAEQVEKIIEEHWRMSSKAYIARKLGFSPSQFCSVLSGYLPDSTVKSKECNTAILEYFRISDGEE